MCVLTVSVLLSPSPSLGAACVNPAARDYCYDLAGARVAELADAPDLGTVSATFQVTELIEFVSS